MNRILIVEGTDNSGKDTLINNLINHYSGIQINHIHFVKPRSRDNKNAALEQNESFLAYANMLNEVDEQFIIFNRAWYGEYVYGTLYRDRSKQEVEEIIKKCEEIILNDHNKVTFVQLYGDADFLAKNDDGNSLSDGKTDKIEIEKNLFLEIFDKSIIPNKIKIKVTENGNFVSKDEILNKVIELIENV